VTAELACNRDAFHPDEVPHYERLLAAWTGAIESRRTLENGLEFDLADPAGTLRETLEAFVPYEQRCCPFLSFDIERAAESRLVFRMTGPPGARKFLLEQASG
jgi:hypothetical protein